MQMKQQKINHSSLCDDCQYSIVQTFLEESQFLCCQNSKASTVKTLYDVCYSKRYTKFTDRVLQLCCSYYFPYIANHQHQVQGNYMAKESVICYA